ncbi:Protein kinase-like domain superfamily [Arabidopsis suecica]|uniref:mitogen-activated protein kinase kinase kinase n=1 Tax=Arabidopsis suecica TaxID=45249 RepID=A0A8T1ZD17_ARASU|nr:Protein kinase-like domain superfamily [Arabidopsis suecica]
MSSSSSFADSDSTSSFLTPSLEFPDRISFREMDLSEAGPSSRDRISFRIQGVEGEIDRINLSPGVFGPDDLAISLKACKKRSFSDSHKVQAQHLSEAGPSGVVVADGGSIITSWQKGQLLGRGSFGSVYEGISGDGDFFAVKEVSLLDQGSQAQECIQQLEGEIALLSQLQHQNIVRYRDTAKDGSNLYIFLELVSQGSLLKLYQRYQLRESVVSLYTRQILDGLKYLHNKGFIHRDIKCANILVDTNGAVKLADFGLAKVSKFNDIKSCMGTPFWMAPEVLNWKDSDGYGSPADIWSLGCTVLEMCTGQIPYSDLEPVQALFRIGRGTLPEVPETLSLDARHFILKCLKVNPEERPTAAELLNHPFVRRPLPSMGSGGSGGSGGPYHPCTAEPSILLIHNLQLKLHFPLRRRQLLCLLLPFFKLCEIMTELVTQLLIISGRSWRYTNTAKQLITLIESNRPMISKIQYSGVELPNHHQAQIRMFVEKLEKGKKLTDKVLSSRRWNLYRRLTLARKMEQLAKTISGICKDAVFTHILADVHNLLAVRWSSSSSSSVNSESTCSFLTPSLEFPDRISFREMDLSKAGPSGTVLNRENIELTRSESIEIRHYSNPEDMVLVTSWLKGQLLGRGSFGSIYEGMSIDGDFFAVSEVSLLDQGSQAKECIHQLEAETTLLSQLQHHNIMSSSSSFADSDSTCSFLTPSLEFPDRISFREMDLSEAGPSGTVADRKIRVPPSRTRFEIVEVE